MKFDRAVLDKIFVNFQPAQNKEELIWLIEHVEKLNPTAIIEIGTGWGGTTKVWEQLLPEDGLLIGIDANCDQAEKVHEILTHTSKKDVHIINGYSCNIDTLNRVREILDGRKVDFVFVDGDHHYEYVKADYNEYRKFLKKGGAMGFHDIASHPFNAPINKKDGLNGGPHRFWKELKGKKFQTQAPHILNVGTGIIYL